MHWFFSYSRKADDESAKTREALWAAMERRHWQVKARLPGVAGKHSVFVDVESLLLGRNWETALHREIDDCDGGILFLTADMENADLQSKRVLLRETSILVHRYTIGKIACVPIIVGTDIDKHNILQIAISNYRSLQAKKIERGSVNPAELDRLVEDLERSVIAGAPGEIKEFKEWPQPSRDIFKAFVAYIDNIDLQGFVKFYFYLKDNGREQDQGFFRFVLGFASAEVRNGYNSADDPGFLDDLAWKRAATMALMDFPQWASTLDGEIKRKYIYHLSLLRDCFLYKLDTTQKLAGAENTGECCAEAQRALGEHVTSRWAHAASGDEIFGGVRSNYMNFIFVYPDGYRPSWEEKREALLEIFQYLTHLEPARRPDGGGDFALARDVHRGLKLRDRQVARRLICIGEHESETPTFATHLKDIVQAVDDAVYSGPRMPVLLCDYKGLSLQAQSARAAPGRKRLNIDTLHEDLMSKPHIAAGAGSFFSFIFVPKNQYEANVPRNAKFMMLELDLPWRHAFQQALNLDSTQFDTRAQ